MVWNGVRIPGPDRNRDEEENIHSKYVSLGDERRKTLLPVHSLSPDLLPQPVY